MSCKHLIWDTYCKEKQEFCNSNLFPRLCDKYETTDMKNSFNKRPAANIAVNPDCSKKYPFEFRFVLTLILGYLNKLTDCAIIIVDDVEPYFKAKIKDVPINDIKKAVNQTRCYVIASNDKKLAEGMRKFEAWFEEYHSKTIPPKELTIADIEKQLGYKIKIIG